MRALSLTNEEGSLPLNGPIRARLAMTGTGMPPVANQWFEGAGEGMTYRGTRVLARTLDMPVKITGSNRAEVWGYYSELASVFDPSFGEVTLTAELDGKEWFTRVARSGGGDFDWSADTDGKTVLLTALTLTAGDPYWTQADQESLRVELGGLGRGLLSGPGAFSKLQLSTSSALGDVVVTNSGDVAVYPVWTVQAPFTRVALTSPKGELVEWTGTKLSGLIKIDMGLGTVVDEGGANAYGALNDVPLFWPIPRRRSTITVQADDATSATLITATWQPKKWVMF